MEQFNLDKWLQDKSRKVVTKDGRPVRIICIDRKAKSGSIVGLVGENESSIYVWQNDGTHAVSGIDTNDLFFADEEELTEFEKEVSTLLTDIVYDYESEQDLCDNEYVKNIANKFLDLARKEIEKDLPKWKKSGDNLPYPYIGGLCQKYLVKNGYYIKISDLETLPKEE